MMVLVIYIDIKNAYSLSDMTRICVNLCLLKKFDFPEEFENNFISAVMKKNARESLDHYKKKAARERSATTYNVTNSIMF
jgi:hypothetical protein